MNQSRQVIINASAHSIPLPSGMIHTVCTSPPYYSLRSYQGQQEVDWPAVSYSPMPGLPPLEVHAMTAALGLEPTPEAYIGHLVLCFREVKRVLREDGTAWVVVGDDYKDGQLQMTPHRLALALQADGWLVRNDAVWAKVAPMPESVRGWAWQKCRIRTRKGRYDTTDKQGVIAKRDHRNAALNEWRENPDEYRTQWKDCPGCPRCESTGGYVLRRGSWRHTRAHETVLMLARSMNYYADQERVREEPSPTAQYGGVYKRQGKLDASRNDADSLNYAGKIITPTPGGRNPRSVLTVESGDAEYDILYRVSPNCPVHGHLARPEIPSGAQYDEPPNQKWNCSPDRCDHRDPLPSPERQDSHNTCADHRRPSMLDCQDQPSACEHSQENRDGSRTQAQPTISDDATVLAETQPRTSHTPDQDGYQGDMSGCSRPACSQTATDHSNRIRKRDRAQLTSSQDMPCAETPSRIEHKSESPASDEHRPGSDENSISPDDSTAHLSEQTSGYTGDIPLALLMTSQPPDDCTCQPCEVYHSLTDSASHNADNPKSVMSPKPESYKKNHYAVYPRTLISPLLRATAPTRVCPMCGAPWCPVVERAGTHTRDSIAEAAIARGRQPFRVDRGVDRTAGGIDRDLPSQYRPINATIAHRPTCDHDADPVPGWCLDPFVGSGTSLEVCAELGVNCVGLDISPQYLDEHAKPRIGLTPSGALETLPLFEGLT